jgi:predicted amidohydrolase YtcJ
MGLGYALMKLNPILLGEERFRRGLELLAQAVHFGGQTTIGDMAVGIFDFDKELSAMQTVLERGEVPFRVEMVPHGVAAGRGRTEKQVEEFMESLPNLNSHRLRFDRRVKLFADGAFFSGLAQLKPPGYLDGHSGEWMMAPPELEHEIRRYWHQGYQIHVHVTGDLGVDLTLDILDRMQQEKPRFNHGFTLEHFGFSTPDQIARAARLGARVSANVYYLHELSDIYARHEVGYERASQMARVGSCMRAGVTTALHSDFTMAPAQPLISMWVAANRVNCAGDVMAAEECLSPYDALAAVTINAAEILGRSADIGSLQAGKLADITILDRDPLTVKPIEIRDISVIATLFEGKLTPCL